MPYILAARVLRVALAVRAGIVVMFVVRFAQFVCSKGNLSGSVLAAGIVCVCVCV